LLGFEDISFEAISINNGWEYALLGVCIVFSGLVILSFVISQLHKMLDLWDNRASLIKALKSRRMGTSSQADPETVPVDPSSSLAEATRHYRLLVDRIGEPFALPKLLRLAEGSGLHRPHAAINELLQAGVILPDETGYYIWKS
jgi:hypothetical protein